MRWIPREDFIRPRPSRAQLRSDLVLAAALLLGGLVMLELSRGFGALSQSSRQLWVQFVFVAVLILPLALRRRFPISVLLVSASCYILVGVISPIVAQQFTAQVGLFLSIFTAIGWARSRTGLWLAIYAVILAMFTWLSIGVALASAAEVLEKGNLSPDQVQGALPPYLSLVLYNYLINVIFFGLAVATGVLAYRSAERSALVEAQAQQIREQSAELADQAVVQERLRIARELHDLVAHHVAGVGVQAGAALHVLEKKGFTPEFEPLIRRVLRDIEGTSRQSVVEMRRLLGMLRSSTEPLAPGADSGAETDAAAAVAPDALGFSSTAGTGPGETEAAASSLGLAAIAQLCASTAGLRISLHITEARAGDFNQVSPAVGLAVYRAVQESLANVVRHSTAQSVEVTLRSGGAGVPWVEAEVLDGGQPRPDPVPGTGYGLRGMHERAALHHGTVEAGPRAEGGFRTRVRYPADGAAPELLTSDEVGSVAGPGFSGEAAHDTLGSGIREH